MKYRNKNIYRMPIYITTEAFSEGMVNIKEALNLATFLKGTLRSNNVDNDENVKKTIRFISKTTALHVHHTFFVHFFPVFARLRRENA